MSRRTYTTEELLDKFVLKLQNGCWRWRGRHNKDGYGVIKYNKQDWRAHRLLYALLIGDIPAGQNLLRDCDIPGCVNPDHHHLGEQADISQVRESRGNTVYGEARGKLTDAEVLEITRKFVAGAKLAALSREYDVDPKTIRDIVYGATWRHLRRGVDTIVPSS